MLSCELAPVGEIAKGIKVTVYHKDNVTTIPSVTTIRPAFGNKFLTPETDLTGTAIPRTHGNFANIHESLHKRGIK
jgi:hypothetical protein